MVIILETEVRFMSFGNDGNIFRELQQFIEDHGDEFETIEEAIETFMAFYQQESMDDDDMEMSPEMESMELFELSLSVKNNTQRRAMLEEAIEIWPENWNAHLELIEGSYMDQVNQIRDLENTAYESWLESEQAGWLNYEERPYLSLKYLFSVLLFKQGLLLEALDHFQVLYEIDEMDSLGSRYFLMAIYCRLYDWESAYALFTDLPYPANSDDRMILPLLVLAILTGNMTYAKDLFLDLEESNDELGLLFTEDSWPVDLILSYAEVDQYQVASFGSLALALNDILPVLVSSEYIYEWMLAQYEAVEPHERVNLSDKVISFKGATKLYNEHQDKYLHYKSYEEVPVLDGVVHNAATTLEAMGLVTIESYAKFTEKELLAIKHVGPKTIQQLKANGVVFKGK